MYLNLSFLSFSSSVDVETGIILSLRTPIAQGDYSVILRVFDNARTPQDNIVLARICDCKGTNYACADKSVAGFGLSGVLGILGAILALLCKMLLFQLCFHMCNSKFYGKEQNE